jgi:hypothetical protein
VHRLTRHLRGLLVAIATLALSAGVVLAARPATVEAPAAAAADGLTTAGAAAGKTVPVQAETPAAPDADEDTDEDAPEVDDEADADAAADRPQNHGWFVSEAAKAATPAGSENHGQVVATIARSDAGKPDTATAASERGASAAAAGKAHKPATTKP